MAFKSYDFERAPSLDKSLRFCQSISINIPFCWKRSLINLVLKRNHSQPPYYRPIAFSSVIFKVGRNILNGMLWQHFNLLTSLERLPQGRTNGDLSILPNSILFSSASR